MLKAASIGIIDYFNTLFDYRFVYLMRHSEGQEKIGIAKNAEKRKNDIERGLKVDVEILFAEKFLFAEKVEKELHNRYSDNSAKVPSKLIKNADLIGKTEWFNFSKVKAFQVWSYMYSTWITQRLSFFFLFALILWLLKL